MDKESRLLTDEEMVQAIADELGRQNDDNFYCPLDIHEVAVAKAQDAKSVKALVEWGDEPCEEHHPYIKGKQYKTRHRCYECWQALKRSIDEK